MSEYELWRRFCGSLKHVAGHSFHGEWKESAALFQQASRSANRQKKHIRLNDTDLRNSVHRDEIEDWRRRRQITAQRLSLIVDRFGSMNRSRNKVET